ncbi:hypothetical protein [Burkholderia guangdongensis]|uniref:hypothetical protein n=1 Tax=Burkholderia guangdongensis TaxID=1792500 RepID=UPI0015C84F55|nr:hypothetical protein [Burkholderia guangdongensis]
MSSIKQEIKVTLERLDEAKTELERLCGINTDAMTVEERVDHMVEIAFLSDYATEAQYALEKEISGAVKERWNELRKAD